MNVSDSRERSSRASTARVYNYYLGGRDHYAVDARAAEQVLDAAPDARDVAKANLRFAGLGAAWAAQRFGIRQVVDIGVGLVGDLPMATVEERVVSAAPHARVIAFDNDPDVLTHARAFRCDPGYVGVLEGDITDLNSIFDNPGARGLLDLRKPMVVIEAAILHFIPGDLPAAINTELAALLAPGSVLVLSHATRDGIERSAVEEMTRAYKPATSQIIFRSEDEIRGMVPPPWQVFDPPGLTDVALWELPEDLAVDLEEMPGDQDRTPGKHVRVLGLVAELGERP